LLIERITGHALEEYFQENIFKPLGVEDCGFWISQAMKTKLSDMNLRNHLDGTVVGIPHIQPAVLGEPGTKIECSGGGGCYGSVREYSSKSAIHPTRQISNPSNQLFEITEILAALLNDGTSPTTGKQILKPETVKRMLENATPDLPNLGRQHLPGMPFISNPSDDLYSQEGNPPQGWSIAGMLNLHPDISTGRNENSVWWAGIGNLYWWVDFEAGVGGIIAAQLLPFMGKLYPT
jgi:CubicO group peptidase (beta-lactamase class C family)